VAMLAAVTMAAAAVVGIVAPGTAGAQTNSRICGNYWSGTYNGGQSEVTWSRVLEVPKSDGISCDVAINRTDRVGSLPKEIANLKGLKWGARQRLQNKQCEWYSQELLNGKYGDDVCLRMLRADNVFQAKDRTISQFWVK
jgi:hypothetical protein